MNVEATVAVLQAGISFFGGLYAILLGFRVIGKKPGQDAKVDAWHQRFGGLMKICGPIMILFGLYSIARLAWP